jgi:hypothetical protein
MPTSYTSGKASAMRTSAVAKSLRTDWYSPPR